VSRIYAGDIAEFEKPNLLKLAELRGDIIVTNPSHQQSYGPPRTDPLTEIAAGFEASYATAAPVTAPLMFDEQLYGFEGYARFLEALIRAFRAGSSNLRQQIADYGLVV
jgi:hypothetical protein